MLYKDTDGLVANTVNGIQAVGPERYDGGTPFITSVIACRDLTHTRGKFQQQDNTRLLPLTHDPVCILFNV